MLLAIWRQMWPALRRDTAFFSFVSEAFPQVDASCVIGLSTVEEAVFRRLKGAAPPEAINILAADLPFRSHAELLYHW